MFVYITNVINIYIYLTFVQPLLIPTLYNISISNQITYNNIVDKLLNRVTNLLKYNCLFSDYNFEVVDRSKTKTIET